MAKLKSMFTKKTFITLSNRAQSSNGDVHVSNKEFLTPAIPDGLWKKCKKSHNAQYNIS